MNTLCVCLCVLALTLGAFLVLSTIALKQAGHYLKDERLLG